MYRTELSRPDNSGMNMILFETMDGVLREKDFLAERHLFYAIEKCSSEQIFMEATRHGSRGQVHRQA